MLIARGPLDLAWAFRSRDRFLPGRNYAKLSQNSSSWVPQSYEFVFQMEKAGTGGVLSGQAKLLGYGGFKMVYEVPEFDIVLKTCKPTPQGELWRTEYELFRSEGFQATWSAHYYGEFESETRKVAICQRACVGFRFLIDCVEIIFEALDKNFHPWDMKLDNWGVLQSQRVVAIDFDVWERGAFSVRTMRLCLEKLLQDAADKAVNTWMGEHLRQDALRYLESLKDQNNQYGPLLEYRTKLLEILNGGMQMARTVESTIGFEDVPSSNDEIGPMIWHAGHRSQAVAMKNYPALLVSCEIKDDHGITNTDAKFVVMFFGMHETESGRLPVVQVMARCQNMILLPKMVLLRMNISGDVSSFAEIVDFDARKTELVPTRFMHLKRDFAWNTVQSVISWDEDRQRVAARLQQVIPFVSDESTGSFSDEVSQDTLAQLEAWFHARFQAVGDPPRVMRKLQGARLLEPSQPAPPKQARTKGQQYPPHVYFSTQEPRRR